MSKKKKTISLLLALIMTLSVFTVVPLGVSAAEEDLTKAAAAEDIAGSSATSGKTGDCTWTLNGTELTISGKGEMADYSPANAPWWGTELTKVTIANGVTRIGTHSFTNYCNAASIIIPNSVTRIGSYAFCGCNAASITIPNSVTEIGFQAFSQCRKLTKITIPNSVTTIGQWAFSECSNLVSVDISNSIQTIPDSTFQGCSALKSVRIPNSVTRIRFRAFYDCTALSGVTIPDTVTDIETEAFDNTAWYNSQPSGLVYAGKVAYKWKGASPEAVTINAGTKGIAASAFMGCSTLKSVMIPDSVISIGGTAFYDCNNLKDVTIPASVKYIGPFPFGYLSGGEKVNGFTIHGYADTQAEIYAKGEGFTFIAIAPPSPTITSLTSDENGINIKWNAFSGAAAYRVYYKNSEGNWKAFGTDVKGTSMVDSGVKYGRKETYTIRAVNSSGKLISGYDNTGWSATYGTAAPQITSLTSNENGITLKWNAVSGASTYRVYYKNASGSWKAFGSDVKGTSLTDSAVSYGRKETYTVRAVNKKGDVMSGYKSDGWSAAYGVSNPQITSLTSDENGITLKWDAVSGAAAYRIYYKTSAGGWKSFKNDVKGTSMTDSAVSYGRKETYTVRAVNKKGAVMSGFKSDGWSATYGVSEPQITSLASDENGIKIEWGSVTGASAYRIYYKTSAGGWKSFKNDVKGTSMTDSAVAYGRVETYTVRAVNKKGAVMSGFKSAGWSAAYGVSEPQITKLENTADGIQISWDEIPGVSTYRIYYKTAAGSWKSFKNDVKGTTMLDKGVKVGRAETYTVRAVNKKGAVMSGFNSDGWSITYQK